MHKCPNHNLAFQKFEKLSQKKSYLIDGPIRRPAGRIGFNEYADQIGVNQGH